MSLNNDDDYELNKRQELETKIEGKNSKQDCNNEHINEENNNQKQLVNILLDDDLEGKMPSKKLSFQGSLKVNIEVYIRD